MIFNMVLVVSGSVFTFSWQCYLSIAVK